MLKLSRKFNQPVDNLPNSLTHLTLSDSFNQPVNLLPPNITHLNFGTANVMSKFRKGRLKIYLAPVISHPFYFEVLNQSTC